MFNKCFEMSYLRKEIARLGIGCLCLALFLVSPAPPEAAAGFLTRGRTMGTKYHIKIADPHAAGTEVLKQEIADRLEQIEQRMSIFRKESELSRFNAFTSTDRWFRASDDFFRLLQVSKKLHMLTGGAWDGTVKSLVDLWGFGTMRKKKRIPDQRQIRKRLKQTGFDLLDIRGDGHVRKRVASVVLDLGSVAKGDAVDEISSLLNSHGFHNYLVEIGGEVFASGVKEDNSPWRVGINQPSPYTSFQQLRRVAELKNQALATSGDYRNFFTVDGKRFSHVIDPKTGYPVSNGVVSASVVAGDCAFADGLATAVMVMGRSAGLALINRLEGVECLIVVRTEDDTLIDYVSNGFNAATSA